MESPLLPIFAFLSILIIGLNASPPSAEMYWKSLLPDTSLPTTLQRLVIASGGGNKSSHYEVEDVPVRFPSYHFYRGDVNKEVVLNQTVFFLYDDLLHHPSKKMRLAFVKPTSKVGFLPRLVAKSTPFSSDKLPAILEKFSVNPESREARIMKDTLETCEAPNDKGEVKYCATSLESMVDFAVSKFGHKVGLLSNEEVQKENKKQRQGYVIVSKGLKRLGDKQIVCHKQGYVYAVFYCHMFNDTKAYMVTMVGEDGSMAKALTVCHTDTSDWNPKHLGLRVLNVKPGTPVCHFLNVESFVWFK